MRNIKLVFWLILSLVIGFFIYSVSAILTPFIASIIIAYFFDPLMLKFEKKGVKRIWTVSIVVGIFSIILITGLLKLIPALFVQIQQFIITIPKYEQYIAINMLPKIDLLISKIDPKLSEEVHTQLMGFSSKFFEYIVLIIRNIFNSSIAVLNIIGLVFFMPILVFYLLRDWPAMVKVFISLFPLSYKGIILEQFKQIDLVLSAYVRGQINVCLILSLFYVMSLSILGLNYALLVGIIAGCLAIIPYLGLVAGGTICALVALFQFSDLKYVYITLVIFFTGHLLESSIITPKLVGEKVGLHPVWVIFSLMSGGVLFGFWGIFFAIPIAAILGVIIRSLIKIYLASQLYQEND